MEITGVGFLCLAMCVLVLARPLTLGIIIFGAFLPLGTASAINMPSVGGFTIVCSYLLIGAILGAIALRPSMTNGFIRHALRLTDGVLLGLFTIYAAASAIFLPRFFEGAVGVYSFSGLFQSGSPLTSLEPAAGNLSQSVFAIGNVVLFLTLSYFLSIEGGFKRSIVLLNTITFVHLLFALFNAVPENGITESILNFVRTADYAIHTQHQVLGHRRLIGSYTEASLFGAISVALFAFNLIRYLQTRGIWSGIASALLLASSIASFSTSAYAALGLLVAIRSLQTSFSLLRSGLKQEDLMLLVINAIAVGAVIVFLLNESLRAFVIDLYEQLFGAKLTSDSGIVRGRWSAQSVSNFIDTHGLGVGLGSARSSGIATALLGNVGVVGSFLFFAFLYIAILRPAAYRRFQSQGRERVLGMRLYSAARAGAIGVLVGALISGTSVNLPLLFFVFAAMSSASLKPEIELRRPVLKTAMRVRHAA